MILTSIIEGAYVGGATHLNDSEAAQVQCKPRRQPLVYAAMLTRRQLYPVQTIRCSPIPTPRPAMHQPGRTSRSWSRTRHLPLIRSDSLIRLLVAIGQDPGSYFMGNFYFTRTPTGISSHCGTLCPLIKMAFGL